MDAVWWCRRGYVRFALLRAGPPPHHAKTARVGGPGLRRKEGSLFCVFTARLKPCPDTCMADGCGVAVQAGVGCWYCHGEQFKDWAMGIGQKSGIAGCRSELGFGASFQQIYFRFTFNNLTPNEMRAFVKLMSLDVEEGSTSFVEIHSEQRSYVTAWSWSGNFRRLRFSWTGKIDKWGNPASGTSDTQTYP
jgi:hypothetical protein